MAAKFNGDRLAHARRAHIKQLSQAELGRLIGKSRGMVARYEQERDVPSDATIAKIAEVLSVPPSYFIEDIKNPQKSGVPSVTLQGEPPEPEISEIPYWGEVPAGDWEMPHGDVLPPMRVEKTLAKPGRVSVRVAGDSMRPRLEHGDVVHIQLSKTPREGCITLARNGDQDLTLKVLRHGKSGDWELHSFNPDYPNPTAPTWEILGYAVVVERYFGPGRYIREVDEVGIRADNRS